VVTKSGSIMRLMAVGDKSPYHSQSGFWVQTPVNDTWRNPAAALGRETGIL